MNAPGHDSDVRQMSALATGPRIHVRVVIDAQTRPSDDWPIRDRHVRHALDQVHGCPAGATVVLRVAAGQPTPLIDRRDLAHLGSITIECPDPQTGIAWWHALNGATPWGV